jgi:acetyl esterase
MINSNNFQRPGPMWKRVVWNILAILALVIAIIIVLIVIGNFIDPASNLFAFVSAGLGTTYGPHMVLLSVIALIIGAIGFRIRPRRLDKVLMLVALVALVGSTIITKQIVGAIDAAGGSVNPVSALWLSSMSGSSADMTETYTTVDGQSLQAVIYKPTSSSPSPAPIIMYIHGGGWTEGNADDTSSQFRWFADQGWLVVSVNYRLATSSNPTWNEAPRDVACALVWTAQNATRLGGDPKRLVVAGDSAGGNLAVNLAYSAAKGQAQSGCGGQVPVPQAVVVQYPGVNPQDLYDHGYPAPGFAPRSLISTYIGGTPQKFPARMQAISSATYLSSKAPQTLIIEPEDDGLNPPDGVYNFVDQARAVGVNMTLVNIPFANHTYDEKAANSLGDQGRLTITQHYLMQRGLLKFR